MWINSKYCFWIFSENWVTFENVFVRGQINSTDLFNNMQMYNQAKSQYQYTCARVDGVESIGIL